MTNSAMVEPASHVQPQLTQTDNPRSFCSAQQQGKQHHVTFSFRTSVGVQHEQTNRKQLYYMSTKIYKLFPNPPSFSSLHSESVYTFRLLKHLFLLFTFGLWLWQTLSYYVHSIRLDHIPFYIHTLHEHKTARFIFTLLLGLHFLSFNRWHLPQTHYILLQKLLPLFLLQFYLFILFKLLLLLRLLLSLTRESSKQVYSNPSFHSNEILHLPSSSTTSDLGDSYPFC